MRGLQFFSDILSRLIKIPKQHISEPAQWIIPNSCPYFEMLQKSVILSPFDSETVSVEVDDGFIPPNLKAIFHPF
jgi:hypothetical protein